MVDNSDSKNKQPVMRERKNRRVLASQFIFSAGIIKYGKYSFKHILVKPVQKDYLPYLKTECTIRLNTNKTFTFLNIKELFAMFDEIDQLLISIEYSKTHFQVKPSEMVFQNGAIIFKGLRFPNRRVRKVTSDILGQIDKTYNLEKKSNGEFRFENKDDFDDLMILIRKIVKRKCNIIEKKVSAQELQSFIQRQTIVLYFRIIDAKYSEGKLYVDKQVVDVDFNTTSSIACEYDTMQRHIRHTIISEIGNDEEYVETISESDWYELICNKAEEIFKEISDVIVIDFPYKYYLLRWLNRSITIIWSDNRVANLLFNTQYNKNKEYFLSVSCYCKNIFDYVNGSVDIEGQYQFGGNDLPMFNLNQKEIDHIKEIVKEIDDSEFSETNIKSVLKDIKRGFLLHTSNYSRMIQEIQIEGFDKIVPYDKLYRFVENNRHYSDDDYSTWKPGNPCYLAVYDNVVTLMQSDSNKAFYQFLTEENFTNVAIFWIWLYFSSSMENKREQYKKHEEISSAFGIYHRSKFSNYNATTFLKQFEKEQNNKG